MNHQPFLVDREGQTAILTINRGEPMSEGQRLRYGLGAAAGCVQFGPFPRDKATEMSGDAAQPGTCPAPHVWVFPIEGMNKPSWDTV